MITAIRTIKKTTLTITTSEELQLEQMRRPNPTKLHEGVNTVVVDAGLFKVRSKMPVDVFADTPDYLWAFTPDDKDGGPIDPVIAAAGADKAAAAEFFLDAKSRRAPE